MKTLYLIRHAKSSWGDASITDYERSLNERGKRDVVVIGNRLLARKICPDSIIASSAKRTRKTAKSIAEITGFDYSKIEFKKELYHSSVHELLNCVNSIPNTNNSVFVIVHNPGVSSFCDYLTNEFYDFPTCAVAKITFEVDSWGEISANLGTLEWFDYPKNNTI